MSSDEARQIAAGNRLSFLHVSKPEIDLPRGTDLYAPEVYAKGKENLDGLIRAGALRQDDKPCFYLYRQVMGGHSQTGIAAVASCQQYEQGLIKKHELTRPDKENDRVRHIETLNAQTGPVFLVYRSVPAINELVTRKTALPPQVDFTAADGVRHTAWVLAEPADIEGLATEFAKVPALYIADGHHRCAAAARVCHDRQGQGDSPYFLSVIFPDDQVQILPYNRVLKDLNGLPPGQLLEKLEGMFACEPAGDGKPARKHELGLFLGGNWQRLRFRPEATAAGDVVAQLDVSLLQKLVLKPIFGIEDPRTSKRINFVGGIRGTAELENLVNSREHACAFSMYPTRIGDLLAVADSGGIMPPKSTWFEPKLRDAMFCQML